MYCIGNTSCGFSSISNVDNIFANGYDALRGAYIVSGYKDVKVFVNGTNNIYSNNSNATSFDIWCNTTTTCKIYCESTGACTNLHLHCYGNCIVSCDDTHGIDCPFASVGSFVELPTESPTTTATPRTSAAGVSETRNNNSVKEWENTGLTIVILCLCCACFLYIIIIVYHEHVVKAKHKHFGSDKPKYFCIVQFILRMSDFWTDLLFCIILYVKNVDVILFWFTFFFILFPFILQIIISLSWVYKWKNWKQDNPKRLRLFLQKYENAILFLTIVAGFYNSWINTRYI